MAVTNTGIVERNITGVNESDLWLDNEATSSVSNTGVVERSIIGVNSSDVPVWKDSESTSTVNNTGVVERGVTGVNESDPMFPNNTISNIINLAGNLLAALFDAFKTRVLADGGIIDNEVGLDIESFDDTASLTMLPNAYKDGKLYTVVPEGGLGDFDVVRGSAATRVNAEGLIESISTIGGELVTNGDFSTDSDWTKVNATISGGLGSLDSTGGTSLLIQTILTDTKTYNVTFTVSNYNGLGETRVADSSGNALYNITSNGTFTFIFTHSSASGSFIFRARTGGIFSIDNVSVKEVIDATNIPRIDYTTGEGVLLTEPQSTNLIPYSEDFSQAVWAKAGNTTIENSHLAPDGTNTAYKVSGTNGELRLSASLSTTTNRSIYARTVSGTGQANLCSFNSNTNNLFTITEEWQRFEVDSSSSTAVGSFYAVDFRGSTTLEEIILWGANATNDQTFATSYIPTSGAIATRLADALSATGDVNTFNDSEGVLYFEGSSLEDGVGDSQISLSDGTNNNLVKFRYDSSAGRFTCFVRGNGGSYLIKTTTGFTQSDNNKIALSWDATSLRIYLNGVQSSSSLINDLPQGLNTLKLNNPLGGGAFEGKTKELRVYPTALTDAELITLTTI